VDTDNQTDKLTSTVRTLRDRCRRRLGSALEAELLIAHALGRDRAWLYAHLDDPIDQSEDIEALVKRRRRGEPIAYILGCREFYGREFLVSPDVLIPRPETELLIDLALDLPLPGAVRALDIGTGSGCIALTLAAERPGWRVMASDISQAALTVARRNCQCLKLEQVELLEADLFPEGTRKNFNLIISNPPYVEENDRHLMQGDVRFEPAVALTPGEDGLAVIRRLVARAGEHLVPGGWLLVEHGHDQGSAVAAIFAEHGFGAVRICKDLAGNDRVTLGSFSS
jgi:release factor glutamine methyltransferase